MRFISTFVFIVAAAGSILLAADATVATKGGNMGDSCCAGKKSQKTMCQHDHPIDTSACTKTAIPVPEKKTGSLICPVMNMAARKDCFTDYKGKRVYFCCPSCKATFEKEPEKYQIKKGKDSSIEKMEKHDHENHQ